MDSNIIEMKKSELTRKILTDNADKEVAKLMMEANPDMCARRAHMELGEYKFYHGNNAVHDLYGWVLWCYVRDYSFERVMASILHDVNGRADSGMAPRTEGFMEEFLIGKE